MNARFWELDRVEGNRVRVTAVNPTAVFWAEYDHDRGELAVQFPTRAYVYSDVPALVWAELLGSPSGAGVNRLLVSSTYPYRFLEEAGALTEAPPTHAKDGMRDPRAADSPDQREAATPAADLDGGQRIGARA